MKLIKLTQAGIAHVIIPIVAVVAVGAIGTVVLGSSHASTPLKYEKYSWSPAVYSIVDSSTPNSVSTVGDKSGLASLYVTSAMYAKKPAPIATVSWIPGTSVYHYVSTPAELLADAPNMCTATTCTAGTRHRLTLAEWNAMGNKTPQTRQLGYYKTASNPTIYAVHPCKNNDPLQVVTLSDWNQVGNPTPQVVSTIPKCF